MPRKVNNEVADEVKELLEENIDNETENNDNLSLIDNKKNSEDIEEMETKNEEEPKHFEIIEKIKNIEKYFNEVDEYFDNISSYQSQNDEYIRRDCAQFPASDFFDDNIQRSCPVTG